MNGHDDLDTMYDEEQDAMSNPEYVAAQERDYEETIRIQTAERRAFIFGELTATAEMDGTMSAAAAVENAEKWNKFSEAYHNAHQRAAWHRFENRGPIDAMLGELDVEGHETVKTYFCAAYWLEIVRQAQIPLPLYPEKQAS